ncbi:MAG: tRNA isopentenyl-2-thiomethyl-A-37 hydroxylase MiaE [Bacteroidota bacterium]
MLCLKCDTKPEWIEAVKKDLHITLIDHAHAEKKAAATGLSLINKYPGKSDLALEMSNLVEEEIGHFRTVLQILTKRGILITKDEGDDYVKSLFSKMNKNEPDRFLDHLLIAGIIEARSCERLQILEQNIDDDELKRLYNDLFPTEAGHYMMFVKLAKKYFNETQVEKRLNELSEFECSIVKSLPNLPTMHG